jgi:serine phosphatase RsbU (regulator of sigma subunit)
MLSSTGVMRITTVTAILCWLALTAVDLVLGFELRNDQVVIGIPRLLSGLLLTGYIVSLYFHYKRRLASADNLDFIDLLWRVFVTGLIATIVSVFIEFFLSFFSGSKLVEHDLILSLLYHINIGLILAFVVSTFLVWKKLVLYQKTKSLLNTWQIFEYAFLASLFFYFIPQARFDLPFSIMFAFLVALGFVVTPNLKWVAFLNFKQKWKSILLILLIILYLGYFLLYIIKWQDNDLLIANLVDHVAVLAVFTFIILYAVASLLVTLFNLPTSSVFEQKLEEVVNFQRLSQSSQTGQDQEEIYDLLLDSSISATFANAAWFEANQQDSNSDLIAKNIEKAAIDRIQQAIEAASAKKPKLAGLSPKKSTKDGTIVENIKDGDYKSLLLYPLEVQNEKIGTMVLLKEVSDGFNRDAINIVNTFGNQAAVSIENHRLLQSAIENERYREELNIAKRVHESLLPSTLESNDFFEITAVSESADEVGGDYFDTYKISENKFALIIGDVSGKGTSAAFNMSQMKGVFHSLAQMDLNPQEFLGRANEALGRCLERTSFITLSYFVVDTESRTVQFSRAGHCPSLYYNESQGKVDFMKSKGLGLGIIRSMEYYKYIEVNELKYNSGDILVMYTDGITEAKNPLNEEFGYERLQMIVQEHVKKSASEIQKAIISGLHDFTQLEEIQDDFTAMIIRFR